MLSGLSLVLLAYNEEQVIARMISSAAAMGGKVAGKHEVVVVCFEGSTDKTNSIATGMAAADKSIRVVMQPASQRGYGVALRLGLEAAKYDYVFYTDADGQFDIAEMPALLPYLGDFDIVSGYRMKRKDPFGRIMSSRVYNLLIRLLFGLRMRDIDSAFKVYRREIFGAFRIGSVGGLVDAEILVKARNHGFRIKEVPIHHYPRFAGKSNYGTGFIKPSVILGVFREIRMLWKELRKGG